MEVSSFKCILSKFIDSPVILIFYFIDSSQNGSDQLTGNIVKNLFILNRHYQILSMITGISRHPAEIWNDCDGFIQGDKSKMRPHMRLRILIFFFGSLIGRIQIGKRILKISDTTFYFCENQTYASLPKHHLRISKII